MLEMITRYNALRQRASNPLRYHVGSANFGPVVGANEAMARASEGILVRGGSEEERTAVATLVEAERQRVEPQALREELQEAAREGREAGSYTGLGSDHDLLFWGQVNGNHGRAGGKALRLAWPAISAEVARLNAAAEAEYQAYRAHCARTPLAQLAAQAVEVVRNSPAQSQVLLRLAYATMGALAGANLL